MESEGACRRMKALTTSVYGGGRRARDFKWDPKAFGMLSLNVSVDACDIQRCSTDDAAVHDGPSSFPVIRRRYAATLAAELLICRKIRSRKKSG